MRIQSACELVTKAAHPRTACDRAHKRRWKILCQHSDQGFGGVPLIKKSCASGGGPSATLSKSGIRPNAMLRSICINSVRFLATCMARSVHRQHGADRIFQSLGTAQIATCMAQHRMAGVVLHTKPAQGMPAQRNAVSTCALAALHAFRDKPQLQRRCRHKQAQGFHALS